MNRSNLVRLVLAAALACIALVTSAQQALEIITLRHRTAEQVLPVLQPLLEPGGTLSGSRGQLFLRASAANAADIKRALDAIDRPLKRLQISVRLDDSLEMERRGVGASGTIGSGGSRIDIRAQDSRRAAEERVDQRVQVLEGGRAMIFAGQSRTLPVPGGAVIQDLATGFEVVPRLAGSDVILEVLQQRETPGAHPGSVQGQRVASMITTRLGEWVEIAATASSAARTDRGIGSASRGSRNDSGRVWLKVEELPN